MMIITFLGEQVQSPGHPDDCFLLFRRENGDIYATQLFKMHDTMGFPLVYSILECRKRGWIPCLEQFVVDAARAWTNEQTSWANASAKARKIVDEAVRDAQSIIA